MTNFWVEKINEAKKGIYQKNIRLEFSSKIKVPQLGSAQLGTFIARFVLEIPAQTHH
jgi:hypothetical protein